MSLATAEGHRGPGGHRHTIATRLDAAAGRVLDVVGFLWTPAFCALGVVLGVALERAIAGAR